MREKKEKRDARVEKKEKRGWGDFNELCKILDPGKPAFSPKKGKPSVVLYGLLRRDHQKEAISIPFGIIPAGSDNSLVWTVLGVRDPVSTAIAIVKGHESFASHESIEQLHQFLFVLGTSYVFYSFVAIAFAMIKIYSWRVWEDQAKVMALQGSEVQNGVVAEQQQDSIEMGKMEARLVSTTDESDTCALSFPCC
ncbi:hypothetical protein AgCh_024790 [Apium graveolens]